MDGLSSSRVILNDHTLALQMPGAEAVHPISLLFAAGATSALSPPICGEK